MIRYRRTIGADAAMAVKDFELDAAYAPTAKKGDLVKLNAAGKVVAAAAADVAVLGVYEGPCVKMEKETIVMGKVRTAPEAVYEMTFSGGTPVADGTGYPIGLTAGDYFLNAAARTTPVVKLIKILPNGNAEVVISGRQLV